MRRAIIGVAAWVLLAGCASVPSFHDALGASYLATKTVAETISAACRHTEPGGPCDPDAPITSQDRDKARALLIEALDMLDLASSLYIAGDETGAQAQLARARSLLALAEGIVRERN